MANGRLPAPSEIFTPLVGVENSVRNLVDAPPRQLGLPILPSLPGPAALVQRIVGQLPKPRIP